MIKVSLSSAEADANFATHLNGAKTPTKVIGLKWCHPEILSVLPVQCLPLTQLISLFCHRKIYFSINEGGKDGPMSRSQVLPVSKIKILLLDKYFGPVSFTTDSTGGKKVLKQSNLFEMLMSDAILH